MTDTITFSLRIPTTLLQAIDHAAQREGATRTAYILSWLPETSHSTDLATQTTGQNGVAKLSA